MLAKIRMLPFELMVLIVAFVAAVVVPDIWVLSHHREIGNCYTLNDDPIIHMNGQSQVMRSAPFDRESAPVGYAERDVDLHKLCVSSNLEDYEITVENSGLEGYVPAYPPFPQYPLPGAKINLPSRPGMATLGYYQDNNGQELSKMVVGGESVRVLSRPDDSGRYKVRILSDNSVVWISGMDLAPDAFALGDVNRGPAGEGAPLWRKVLSWCWYHWIWTIFLFFLLRMFLGDLRFSRHKKPKQVRDEDFAQAERGVPYCKFERTANGVRAVFRCPPLEFRELLKGTRVEVMKDMVVINDHLKLKMKDFGSFCISHIYRSQDGKGSTAAVLGYVYGDRVYSFGGRWKQGAAEEVAASLNSYLREITGRNSGGQRPKGSNSAPSKPHPQRVSDF